MLLTTTNTTQSANEHLFKKLPYDPVKDFDPLLPLFKAYFFFTVATDMNRVSPISWFARPCATRCRSS